MAYKWKDHEQELKTIMPETFGKQFLILQEEGGYKRTNKIKDFDYPTLAREIIGVQRLLQAYITATKDPEMNEENYKQKTRVEFVKSVLSHSDNVDNTKSVLEETSVTGYSFEKLARALNRAVSFLVTPEKKSASVNDGIFERKNVLDAKSALRVRSTEGQLVPILARMKV